MKILKRGKTLKIDQTGFSLVELIIVIAILSVVMGMFMMGINLIFTLPARQCARELKSAIEKTRIDTMGKEDGDAKLVISVKEDGVYAEEVYEKSKKGLSPTEVSSKLCDRKVLIYWGKGTTTPLQESETKTLSFKRETGGFSGLDYTSEITIISGSDTWKLTLYKLTGIVELERG